MTADTASDSAKYPFGIDLPLGEARPVAEGVFWLRMPLPFSLDHINVWVIRDGDGWTLVDTGIHSRRTVAMWEAAMTGPLQALPIRRVICTHMHPDHIGMAGWITRRFDCALWITRLEYLNCRVLAADTGREAPADAIRFYKAAGWDERTLERYKARFGDFGRGVHPLPDSYRRVVEGEQIVIGNRAWHAVVGRGHSPEHLCLYCPEIALLISGDQVLPKISTNVSVFPMEPQADPLGEWLQSLASIKRAVRNDVVVLPSHNAPFRGLHERLDELADGHARSLTRLSEALTENRRVVDLFAVLFRRPIDDELLGLATGETLAHLSCLIGRGLVQREVDGDGVAWYHRR